MGAVTDNGDATKGWYKDPTRHHAERWFSAGTPTALVRDGHTTGHDPLSESEAAAAASGTLEFVSLPSGRPTETDGGDRPPPGQVAWWDVAVPHKDEPGFDWGLDGYVGYKITLAERFAARWSKRRREDRSKN